MDKGRRAERLQIHSFVLYATTTNTHLTCDQVLLPPWETGEERKSRAWSQVPRAAFQLLSVSYASWVCRRPGWCVGNDVVKRWWVWGVLVTRTLPKSRQNKCSSVLLLIVDCDSVYLVFLQGFEANARQRIASPTRHDKVTITLMISVGGLPTFGRISSTDCWPIINRSLTERLATIFVIIAQGALTALFWMARQIELNWQELD